MIFSDILIASFSIKWHAMVQNTCLTELINNTYFCCVHIPIFIEFKKGKTIGLLFPALPQEQKKTVLLWLLRFKQLFLWLFKCNTKTLCVK